MSHESNQVWKEFEENEITHSVAHYLMAIDELHEDVGYARAVDISKELEISAASCSNGIKSLLRKGLIEEDKNKFLLLSEDGKHAVEKIKTNRELFIQFFSEVLGAKTEESVVNACKIEHLISPHIARKLGKFLEKNKS
ncbi:metal-dependent transcriptional regulator [Candidatus Gracilibacteria bacterium]|nr:metal-dependent transcriptional regulator [Candidatus Gracilibacteria bacterium]